MVEVQLYVYDLSQGIARNMSVALTGSHFDAIYHTSVVLFGTEYYFGNGIQQTSPPGSTHHGNPIEIIKMGETQIDQGTFQEYLESLQTIYTPESYDLLSKNCNNFSDDVCQFLVDKKIPSHITNLPSDFLKTPFGQMIAPQLGPMFRPITQAASVPPPTSRPSKMVQIVRDVSDLGRHIANAPYGCSVLFFTSASCPPCRAIQPTFERLASELGNSCAFLKISVDQAQDCGRKYNIRATPTFISLLKGAIVC
ncbi:Desumoylating isopeptidase 1 [Neolecta irregularis DAH-3]|uniref:Desumoylating isopeptidase 1 n=1 Tax=Neolecta irregularis (strain DAH-3) TaxID=1198029 RepID=A0A1U7LGZ0_NEOID|nr:Desumoylating isopeptidase 1 [Neolecta irregularis DAH-3]|eukprot:OLL21914.1 Desumoylating isopeptidase 1 [Neolecta irregularis DAH-3]